MKRLILSTVLMLISLQAQLYAQSDYVRQKSKSKAEQTFDGGTLINIRDFVVLKEGKMILELATAEDYNAFKNMDSLLTGFMKDIAFYKDSMAADPTDHLRIDYVINDAYSFKKIRFKKYKADGNIFMNRDGEIAKLKFDQDTVRIIIQRSMPGIGRGVNGPCSVAYSVQATFILGNYYDVEKIVADKILTHVIDTLQSTTPVIPLRKIYSHNTSINYNPYYSGALRYHQYRFMINNEYAPFDEYRKPKFTFNPQLGIGMVRNTFAPIADIGVQYNKFWNNNKERDILRLSAKGYYFFDKDEKGNFLVSDNWFANISFGNVSTRNFSGWFGKQADFGMGYLVSQKGGYFKGNTFRAFTDIMFIDGLTISPEVIFTNDFKQIFPGITIKVL